MYKFSMCKFHILTTYFLFSPLSQGSFCHFQFRKVRLIGELYSRREVQVKPLQFFFYPHQIINTQERFLLIYKNSAASLFGIIYREGFAFFAMDFSMVFIGSLITEIVLAIIKRKKNNKNVSA